MEVPHSMLILLYETRWQKTTAVKRFIEIFSGVLVTLQHNGRECATQAYQLHITMESSQFQEKFSRLPQT